MNPILIVDNEEKFCKVIKSALELENIPAEYVLSAEKAIDWTGDQDTDIIISDLKMDGIDGLELLRRLKKENPEIEFIIMTAFASQKTAIDALKEGAMDYLIKPFEMDELVLRIRRIQQQKQLSEENRSLKSQIQKPVFFEAIVGRSQAMVQVYNLIKKAAASDSTVLILGESGTGKELVAETIHNESQRNQYPMVAINCAAVPENLLESELFGYEKGAFTGAFQRKIGKFELAAEGTIFLDEIGDMSPGLQVKLLRVLQNRELTRVGGNQPIPVNTRVVAATHRDLDKMVAEKTFRQDLYYRLNVFPIHLPPLRERKEDLPELVNHFIKFYEIVGIEREALKMLMEYDWPGNVRELQNVLERASILADSVISKSDLPPLKPSSMQSEYSFNLPDEGFHLDEFEKFLIKQALRKAGGSKTDAARMLGITRRRLYSLMNSLKIDK